MGSWGRLVFWPGGLLATTRDRRNNRTTHKLSTDNLFDLTLCAEPK